MQKNELAREIFALKDRIVKHFNEGNWQDIAILTGSSELINNHPRLLRSYGFGDSDYSGHVSHVLSEIASADPENLKSIREYLDDRFEEEGTFISARPSKRKITFAPSVFNIQDIVIREDLVAVMMPFAGFDDVHAAIKSACADADLTCLRADDLWEESTFIQDIVNLIVQARIVICDFSNCNPNVFYETGIAHTLGKEVVPIMQSEKDIPSDLHHHRALPYLPNAEGLQKLRTELASRLRTIIGK